jgi:hypothetical protein
MSMENPLWGAPRIRGELLKLGFEIAESTVSKYMIRRRGPQPLRPGLLAGNYDIDPTPAAQAMIGNEYATFVPTRPTHSNDFISAGK